MRKRWKWLIGGLVVILLGAFLMIPSESDGLDAFRRLGPISEESSSLPAVRGLIAGPTNHRMFMSGEIYSKKFTYGRLSDLELEALKKAYYDHSAQPYPGASERWFNSSSASLISNERSVVKMSFMKEPTKWGRLWTKVKAFFGRS